MKKNSLIKLACTQMSTELNKLLLEISNITDNFPVNSTTNKNSDNVNNTKANSAAAIVDLYALINNIAQCNNDVLSNLPELPVPVLNRKSRKQY